MSWLRGVEVVEKKVRIDLSSQTGELRDKVSGPGNSFSFSEGRLPTFTAR